MNKFDKQIQLNNFREDWAKIVRQRVIKWFDMNP